MPGTQTRGAAGPVPWDVRLCLLYNRLFGVWGRRNPFTRECAELGHLWNNDRAEAGRRFVDLGYAKGDKFLRTFPEIDLVGRRVLDFGSGSGGASLLYAERGATQVIGVDISEASLAIAHEAIAQRRGHGAGAGPPIEFRRGGTRTIPLEDESVDLVLSEDAVEHLEDPEAIFHEWWRVLAPGGKVILSFGPLWYHPHGLHLWDIFPAPWTHVLFPERTCVRARNLLKADGGQQQTWTGLGMNRMTLRRFARLVATSNFRPALMRVHAVRGLQPLLRVPGIREFFASEVDCILEK
ncbi:MAG TPA: class I SAM-dependent methyltransferase [Isosphaeraceae bacterium]|jgi:SAM-dependent methyltransferase